MTFCFPGKPPTMPRIPVLEAGAARSAGMALTVDAKCLTVVATRIASRKNLPCQEPVPVVVAGIISQQETVNIVLQAVATITSNPFYPSATVKNSWVWPMKTFPWISFWKWKKLFSCLIRYGVSIIKQGSNLITRCAGCHVSISWYVKIERHRRRAACCPPRYPMIIEMIEIHTSITANSEDA